MRKIAIISRWMVTTLLIYGAYTETGIYTGISLYLIFIAIEVMWLEMRKVK